MIRQEDPLQEAPFEGKEETLEAEEEDFPMEEEDCSGNASALQLRKN